MAVDPRKRQKKLQRKAAKDKAKRREMAYRNRNALEIRLQGAAKAPVLHCFYGDVLFDQGMATVLVSRVLSNGEVAFGMFLIDSYCLGVKSAWYGVEPRGIYESRIYEPILRNEKPVPVTPAVALKLVESAVAYAANLGFTPDRDYAKAKLIFGDADSSQCTEEFTFGRDGKPFYVSGPLDSEVRARRIVEILEQRCGPGNYDFLINIGPPHYRISDAETLESSMSEEGDDWDEELDEEGDDDGTIDGRVLRYDE